MRFIILLAASVCAAAGSETVLYWGQNRGGSQKSLLYYCKNTDATMILLEDLNVYPNFELTFRSNCSNGGSGSKIADTQLQNCPDIRQGIQDCKSMGKKVLLSLRGSEPFGSASKASDYADKLWSAFGPMQPGYTGPRPFGDAQVDGFNFLEAGSDYGTFISRIRSHKNDILIGLAPSCEGFGDLAVVVRHSLNFYLFIKFNEPKCGVKAKFDWKMWCEYSLGFLQRKIDYFVGITANASDSEYVSASDLKNLLVDARRCPLFGGVVILDASSAEANGDYTKQVSNILLNNS